MHTLVRALLVYALVQTATAQVAMSANLSRTLRSAMAGREGAAVVLDVAAGKLLGSYDLKRAATRLATPGSSIKPFVLQVLLESHRIDPVTALACRRQLTLDKHRLDCTHTEAAGMLSAADALAFSCNSYFANVATLLRPGELESELQRFGLTSATGLLKSEAFGRINKSQTVPQRQLLATGAAGIEVTPLGLAMAYRRLAMLSHEGKLAPAVRSGLQNSTEYGMGRLAHSGSITMAGKTGTASDAHDPHTHAWFAGFAPSDDPSVVVVVFLERGRGSVDAASVARQLFDSLAQSLTAPPSHAARRR